MTDTKTPSPSDAELQPCPFCGNQPEPNGYYTVTCMACGVSGPSGGNFEEVRAAWNRRAAPQPAPVREPLMNGEILDEFCVTPGIYQFIQAFMAGARFAERAHGITANSEKGGGNA